MCFSFALESENEREREAFKRSHLGKANKKLGQADTQLTHNMHRREVPYSVDTNKVIANHTIWEVVLQSQASVIFEDSRDNQHLVFTLRF